MKSTKNLTFYFVLIILFTIFISIFFTPFISTNNSTNNLTIDNTKFIINNNLCWPLPGYTRISSYYGNRVAPTSGATSFHSGIDIPAPEGTNIVSIISGKVVRTGFIGSGGYSIIISNENYTITFHHISPNYLVHLGDYVSQGQIIAQVGPKNVYNVLNNPYKDSNGNPTNGATTGCHLHLSIKKDNQNINPLSIFTQI